MGLFSNSYFNCVTVNECQCLNFLFQLEMCVCAAKNSDFALADNAVVIDLSNLNTVTVDIQSKVRSKRFFLSLKKFKTTRKIFNQVTLWLQIRPILTLY